MLLRTLVVVGLVSFTANIAAAQTVALHTLQPHQAIEGVALAEPDDALAHNRFALRAETPAPERFANLTPANSRAERAHDRRYELALVARAPRGMEVALAQRASVGFDASGDLARESRSSELRLGRGLQSMRRDAPSSTPRWYFFAAAEDEALIWSPGRQTNAFGAAVPHFALQDRVEVGDVQAGITYEIYGMQASLAYVEREISLHSGSLSVSEDERFAGFTLTMRR